LEFLFVILNDTRDPGFLVGMSKTLIPRFRLGVTREPNWGLRDLAFEDLSLRLPLGLKLGVTQNRSAFCAHPFIYLFRAVIYA
jgi:hypothetical protein